MLCVGGEEGREWEGEREKEKGEREREGEEERVFMVATTMVL